MDYFIVTGLAVLTLVFIIIDLIANKALKVKRNIFGWIFLSSMIIMLTLSGYYSIKNINAKSTKGDTATYLSYRYLLDGNTQNARAFLDELSRVDTEQAHLLELMTLCKEGDYSRAYFLSNRLLNEGIVKNYNAQSVASLNKLSKHMLNISEEDAVSDNLDETDLSFVSTDYEEEHNQKINESIDIVQNIILESFNLKPFVDPIKLEKAYKLDNELRTEEFGTLTRDEVLSIVKEYGEDQNILKAAIKFTTQIKDYKKSME